MPPLSRLLPGAALLQRLRIQLRDIYNLAVVRMVADEKRLRHILRHGEDDPLLLGVRQKEA